jgi:7,8-dihydropterin-6-yl-methyl-4-(beta-D-ribofuranosyl)aminobenzene 5'-phosphate synthase
MSDSSCAMSKVCDCSFDKVSHAMLIIADKGIVMLTGCSHAGVVNCTQHALELAGGSIPLHAVIGGFHLATSDANQIERSIKDLLKFDPAVLLPGHCTGWRAKFAIEKRQPGLLVPCSVGYNITF